MKRKIGKIMLVCTLTGIAAGTAWADNSSEIVPFTPKTGGSGDGCPGAYVGYAKMTNNINGTTWLTPPINAVSGTLTNASGLFGATYVMRKSDSVSWCGTNTITFPATNATTYELMVYVKTTPVPTNGQPINLQVTWQ